MNNKYLMVEKIIKDNFAAAINSYESLPVNYKQARTSSDVLISSPEPTENERYEEDNSEQDQYPFQTIDKMHKKLTRED
jgi:hypothetical protein